MGEFVLPVQITKGEKKLCRLSLVTSQVLCPLFSNHFCLPLVLAVNPSGIMCYVNVTCCYMCAKSFPIFFISDTIDLQLYSSSLGLDGMQSELWRELAHVIVGLHLLSWEHCGERGRFLTAGQSKCDTRLGERQEEGPPGRIWVLSGTEVDHETTTPLF